MPTAKRQFALIAASVTVLSLTLVACGGSEEPLAVSEGAQAGDLVGLEACTYEADDAEYAADCGTLVVPENRDDADSRLIALPVIRIRATGGNPTEPIFWLSSPSSLITACALAILVSSVVITFAEFRITAFPVAVCVAAESVVAAVWLADRDISSALAFISVIAVATA